MIFSFYLFFPLVIIREPDFINFSQLFLVLFLLIPALTLSVFFFFLPIGFPCFCVLVFQDINCCQWLLFFQDCFGSPGHLSYTIFMGVWERERVNIIAQLSWWTKQHLFFIITFFSFEFYWDVNVRLQHDDLVCIYHEMITKIILINICHLIKIQNK